MSKTYKTKQDLLLESAEDEVYHRTNVDPKVWTPERTAEREELEQRAFLRANVRVAGRRALLDRQREFLEEESATAPGEIPKVKPIPSLGVLSNIRVQEEAGAELLLKDPTEFFEFEGGSDDHRDSSGAAEDSTETDPRGPTLGSPIAIRDPLRTGAPQGTVFPVGLGKLPKPDVRTEKEKKRQEREEKLWAAAQGNAESDEIDLAVEEDEFQGEPLDYDKNFDWDSDDEEWEKGLDPVMDADILSTPKQYRYRQEEIDFVIAELEKKATTMGSHLKNSIQTMEQEKRSRMERQESETSSEKEKEGDDDAVFFDAATSSQLLAAGADVNKFEILLKTLTEEQLLSIFSLGAKGADGSKGSSGSLFDGVDGLTDDQKLGLSELEEVLLKIEENSAAS